MKRRRMTPSRARFEAVIASGVAIVPAARGDTMCRCWWSKRHSQYCELIGPVVVNARNQGATWEEVAMEVERRLGIKAPSRVMMRSRARVVMEWALKESRALIEKVGGVPLIRGRVMRESTSGIVWASHT